MMSFWRYNVTEFDTIGLILYHTDIVSFHIGRERFFSNFPTRLLKIK